MDQSVGWFQAVLVALCLGAVRGRISCCVALAAWLTDNVWSSAPDIADAFFAGRHMDRLLQSRWPAVVEALQSNDVLCVVRMLYEYLDRSLELDQTLLESAAKHGVMPVVGFALRRGAWPSGPVLGLAVAHHQHDVVRALLAHGADPRSLSDEQHRIEVRQYLK